MLETETWESIERNCTTFLKSNFEDACEDRSLRPDRHRFVFLSRPARIAVPPKRNRSVQAFDRGMSLAFLLAAQVAYPAGFSVGCHIFGRSTTERLLPGMTTAFANQVFFVLPISRQGGESRQEGPVPAN